MTKDELIEMALMALQTSRRQWDNLMDLMKDDPAMNNLMRFEWNLRARGTEASIRDYYRESDIWFVNTFLHGYGGLLAMTDPAMIKQEQKWNPESWFQPFTTDYAIRGPILDYGGGFFKDTWPLVNAGYHVAQAEVKGPVTEFLKIFRSAANLERKITIIEVDSDTPIQDMYSGVVCFEVLEHLLYPVRFMAHLHQHLHFGQPIAWSASFGATDHAPYHVAANAALGCEGVMEKNLEVIGFQREWQAPDHHRQIWRRI